jgi:hypothetical protein
MNNTKALVLKKFGIPSTVSYSQSANAFLSSGYTSMAGNTYYNAVRFAEGVIIKEDIGQGYIHTFLNGLKIYSLKDKTLLADKTFHARVYSKWFIQETATQMLLEVLSDAARYEGVSLNETEARREIGRIVNEALNTDQVEMLRRQSQKYLGQ